MAHKLRADEGEGIEVNHYYFSLKVKHVEKKEPFLGHRIENKVYQCEGKRDCDS